jgi:hypothetical protein
MAKRQVFPTVPSAPLQTSQREAGQSRRACPKTSAFWLPATAWDSLIVLLLLQSAFGFQPPNRHMPPVFFPGNTETAAIARPRCYASDDNRNRPLRMVATTTEVMASGVQSPAAVGRWEEVEGNFVLRPSVEDGPPRALGMCHAVRA